MYVNKKTGNKLSVQDMQKYADENEVSIEEYARDFGFVLEETTQDTSSADLLDPTTFQTDAAAGADVVSQPMTASQAGYVEPEDTELAPVDTSLDSQDLANEDFTLEQFKLMTPKEKNALSYSEKQRLSREKNNEKNNVLDEIESEASKKFKSGALRVGSNLAQIPAFINRLKMTTLMGIAGPAFKEDIDKFKELDSATQDRIAQAIGSFSGGPIGNIGVAGSIGLEAAENLKNKAKKIEETLTKYDNTIGQDFIEGNVSQAVSRTFNEVIGTIPSIAQAFVPYVGISSIVAGSAADYSTEALAEGKKLDAANMIAATATGFSEGLLELTTKKIGKGLFKSLAGKSKDVVSKTLKEAALQTAKEAGQEGLSESTTEVLNRSIDALYKNKGDEWDNIWPELADVFIIGAAAGGGMSGTGNTGSIINKAVQVNSVNRTLQENNSQSVLDSFEKDPISKETINIAKNKYSGNILDIELKNKVSNGDISVEESKSIKQKFDVTRKNIQLTSDLKINENLIQETIGLLDERESLSSEIAKAKGNKSLVQTQQSRLNDIDSRLSKISTENKLSITTETVKNLAKDIKGLTVESLDNADAIVNFIKENKIDIDSKKASNEQGFIYQNPKTGEQTIVINKEIAAKDRAVNVAAHEFLHGLIFQTVKNSPETQIALGKSLNEYINKIDVNQIKDSNFAERLKSYKDMDEATQSEEVLTLFSDAIATGDIQFNESVFTKIGDVIRRTLQNLGVKVKFNNGKDVYNFVKDYNKSIEKGKLTKAQKAVSKKGAEGTLVLEKTVKTEPGIKESKSSTDLETELDNLDASDYNDPGEFDAIVQNLEFKIKAAKKKEAAKPKEKDKTKTKTDSKKNKKQLGDQFDEMVPKGTTKATYAKDIAGKVVDKINGGMLDPLIVQIAAGYGIVKLDNIYGKNLDDFIKDVISEQFIKNIMNYDPLAANKSLGGYIIAGPYGIRNRVKEALIKGKKEAAAGSGVGLDKAKNVTSRGELEAQEAEKSKYVLLTKSNIVPSFTTKAITEKLTSIVSKLKSKITDAAGKNNSSPPLIREMKNEIGKVVGDAGAIPKLVIARLGNLKDGSYKSNLIKHKKAIIENMTTTFLMGKDAKKEVIGGIPMAIEKSVGGSFRVDENGNRVKVTVDVGGKDVVQDVFDPKFIPYPDWVGQEIDREKTLVRGATAGNQIVRRVSADKVSDDAFVSLFIDEKGKLISGRREAIGKAIGEEIAFEIFSKEIQNENSEISKAFDTNQEALGEVLADNFVNVLLKDIDRGTVKFSKGKAFRTTIKEIDASIDNIINYLNEKNIYNVGGYGMLNELSLKDPVLSELMKKNRELWQAYVLQGNKSKLTPIQQKKFLNIKNKSGVEYQKWINNSLNYYFNAINATFGLEPGVATLQNPNAKAAALDTIGKLLEDIIFTNKINPIEEFLNITKGWTVSGKSTSIFGNNTGLYNWITSKERSELIQNTVSKSGLNLRSSKGSETNKTLYLNNKKALNTIKQETTGKDLISIYKGKNEVELTDRDIQSNIAEKHLKTIFDFLQKQYTEKTILPEGVALILKTMNSSMRGALKTAAKIEGAYLVEGLEAGDYTFEHGIPVTVISTMAAKYITDPKFEWDNIQNAIDKSKVYIIPKKIAKIIDTFYKATFSIDNALDTENPAIYRYQEVNKGLKDALKAAGVVNFDFNNFTYFRDPKKSVKRNIKFSKGVELNLVETGQQAINNARSLAYNNNVKRLDITEKDINVNLLPDEIAIYHGGDIKKIDDINGIVYFSEDKAQAAEYAKGNEGKVAEFKIKESDIVSEDVIYNEIDELGLKARDGFEVDELNLYELIDPAFETSLSRSDLAKLFKSLNKKGIKAVRFTDMNLKSLKNDISNIAVFDKKTIQEPKKLSDKEIANFIISKVAEGYNDFYFADDTIKNASAVKNVLNTFDVKGKVQQAKVKFSKSMNTTFNEMLQRSTGIEAGETIERSIARRRGATKGKFKVWMPSSLDDFKGLTSYTFAGKGRQGEADQKFFQDALITPYFRGIRAIEQSRQAFIDDFKTLNKQMRPVLKKLGKIVPGTEFTHDQAIRIALWTASGYDIPGISESDIKTLVDFVNDNADLSEYTRKLQLISKRKKWAKPGDFWDAETILSDLNNLTEKVGRKEYLTEFIENVDIIFSEDNLNKVEAGYGEAQKEALKDIIYRMKNGTNRPSGSKKNENRFNNWVNNSIGAIMFFNRRSALLQTLSIANFINWGDNNVLKAGAAFANQPQYWKDFATLFNSSKLKQRRSGLKSDVNEAEIANAVKGSRNKAVSALSYLLKIGFTPTQLADSFAIASGGATFYRNRINSYLKEQVVDKELTKKNRKITYVNKYTKEQAAEKAFEDFSQISEETQQSGDPALISSDQASTLGRMILAFQNTPIQLNRSIKKAALDIKNRRRTPGQTMLQSDFSNISKIIYYGTVQNIIFSALQNALFALIPGFEDEDDELTEEEQLEKYGKIYSTKQSRIVNGMVDTTLKGGFGVPGAFISTIKNAYLEWEKQKEKGFIGDQGYTILAAANLSPPVGSKLRKIYSAIKTEEFDKDVIAKRGWDVTIDGKFNLSPAYKVLGSVTEGLTNLPLDRMVAEISSVTEALDARNSKWQRIALALGWKTWDVNVKNEEHELIKAEAKAKRKEEGKVKAKETRAKNKKTADAFYKKVGKTLSKKEKQKYFSFSGKTRRREYLNKIAKEKGIK